MENFSATFPWPKLLRGLAGLALLVGPAPAAQAQSFSPVATYATSGSTPNFVATGDLNGDGQPDIVASNYGPSTLSVLLKQAGTGYATAVTYPTGGNSPYEVVLGDVNRDGQLDAVVTNFTSNNVSVLLGTGTGTFGTAAVYATGAGTNPFGVQLADMNGDGWLDIVTGNSFFSNGNGTTGSVSILLNSTSGTYGAATAYATGGSPRSIALADFNKDGALDIAVTSANTTNNTTGTNLLYVLLRQGSGFAPVVSYAVGSSTYILTTGDVNQDGQPDIVFPRASAGNTIGVLTGQPGGTFNPMVTYAAGGTFPSGVDLGDVNGDGLLDAVVSNYNNNSADVLLGTSTGTFGTATPFSTGANGRPYDVRLVDLNADGKLDVLVANSSSYSAGVLLNTAVYNTPVLTGISPSSGPVGTGVTLTGTNLAGVTGVTFNGVPATVFAGVSGTSATATVPAGATTGTVTVTTPGGTSNGLTFTVTYPDLVVNTTTTIAAGTYNSITVNSPGNATLAGNVTVNSFITVNSGATLNDGCFVLSGSSGFTLAAGATLGICHAAGIAASGATGAVQVTGNRLFNPDASYVYNGTAAQSTGNGLPGQVRNLTTTNANSVTLSGPVGVAQVLTVGAAGNLVSNGALTLRSSASGTALIVNSGSGVVSGNATLQRYIDPSKNAGLGYRHLSPGVNGSTIADFGTATFTPVLNPSYNTSPTPGLVTPFPTVFQYNQALLASANNNMAAFDKGWNSPLALTNTLTPGAGYAVHLGGGELVDFTGAPFTSTTTFFMNRTAAGTANAAEAGWQLLGNPYPAPFDFNLVDLADRPGLDAAMYVFESSGPYTGMYRAYVNNLPAGGGIIGNNQGFFVRVAAGQTNGSLTFRNSQRLTTYGSQVPVYRTATDPRPLVQLELRGTGLADVFYAYAEAGATPAFDSQFDAVKMTNSTGLNLSSTASTSENLAIDGRGAFTSASVLPLNVGVPAAGTYTLNTLQINNLPASLAAYLVDAQTGQTVALGAGSRYSFSVTAAQSLAPITGRFSLQFRVQGVLATTAGLTAASVSIYPNPAHGSFVVAVPAVAGATAVEAELLNALGQVVRRQRAALPAAGTSFPVPTADLAPGVYTLRLQAGSASLAQRVVLN